MKIAVCMKLIPDLEQIRIKERQPVLEGVPLRFCQMSLKYNKILEIKDLQIWRRRETSF